MAGFIRKIGHKLSHRIQRDVGHLALLFVRQEGVAEGFLLIKRVFIISPLE